MRFADDVVLFAKSGEELQHMLTDLNRESKEAGLQMNASETKLMTYASPVRIDNEPMDYMEE